MLCLQRTSLLLSIPRPFSTKICLQFLLSPRSLRNTSAIFQPLPSSSNSLPSATANNFCSTWSQKKLHKSTTKSISILKLMRAHAPIGSWLLYWPCAWSITFSAPSGCFPDVRLLALFAAGAFLMRSAGCVFNDLWDVDFDKKVERTKSRPLASGEIVESEAVLLLAGLLSASLAILLQLNSLSILVGASSLWLVVIYPLAKRFIGWPQLVLGATFNWGALLGTTASTGQLSLSACVPLYLACICWTMVYDTIYAYQDKSDDALIGLKSTAIAFGDKMHFWLSLFAGGMVAGLALEGFLTEQEWPFFVSLGAVALHLCWQISTLNPGNSADCWNKFRSNQWIGIAMFVGILLSNLLKEQEVRDLRQWKGEEEQNYGIDKRNLNINFYS